ncbi:acylphosphatase [Microbacterium oryzae]|uniref:acylphosphatase n=1 Tax=Microbacterium oryzae TaxID=743009 RepID=A0A6I6E1Q8_9MICO|nr:acylphosphatase [Microbacterium oryzae]QGU27819.1 acylphosphatase [Microbacterium oryzae]
MAEARRVRVVVAGGVQGVGFRWSTARQAERLGVSGWVRNAGSTTVEAELEGAPDAVQAVVDWMRHGPVGARVDALTVEDTTAQGTSDFEVSASR